KEGTGDKFGTPHICYMREHLLIFILPILHWKCGNHILYFRYGAILGMNTTFSTWANPSPYLTVVGLLEVTILEGKILFIFE
ncbi:hypothetical protein ACJX0J_008898, partial [Zea mays]